MRLSGRLVKFNFQLQEHCWRQYREELQRFGLMVLVAKLRHQLERELGHLGCLVARRRYLRIELPKLTTSSCGPQLVWLSTGFGIRALDFKLPVSASCRQAQSTVI